ncbi:SDR family oxidoreductase [Profundibacter sp.]|uniref:SDR family oxidoreductase n=1 Tax=Profundibacter sp. TaxID=3101071 RepID=UPI003D13A8D6
MARLAGKQIFITGAAQGIGLAIARACLREGAQVFLTDRDGRTLEQAVTELEADAGQLGHAVADITDQDAINASVEKARALFGGVNALINNAGINVFHDPLSMPDSEWEKCMDVDLKGAWNCCKAVLPAMIAEGAGCILNIASTHAFTIIPHTFPYPVAKHALLGMTRALGIEYAPHGVRVNALAPGYVETQKNIDYWNSFPDPQAARAQTLALHPGGRIATPEEIAMAAVFLISDECPFINAACLTADGGLSVLHHPA